MPPPAMTMLWASAASAMPIILPTLWSVVLVRLWIICFLLFRGQAGIYLYGRSNNPPRALHCTALVQASLLIPHVAIIVELNEWERNGSEAAHACHRHMRARGEPAAPTSCLLSHVIRPSSTRPIQVH